VKIGLLEKLSSILNTNEDNLETMETMSSYYIFLSARKYAKSFHALPHLLSRTNHGLVSFVSMLSLYLSASIVFFYFSFKIYFFWGGSRV
jgi:hypothetical protein